MPVIDDYEEGHREILHDPSAEAFSLVARPVRPAEMLTNARARAAVQEEWKKLRTINTWLEDQVE